MTILFAGSEINDFVTVGTITYDTGAGRHDTSYIRFGGVATGVVRNSNYIEREFTPNSDVWVTFRVYTQNVGGTGDGSYLILGTSSTGNLFRLASISSALELAFQRWSGSAWVTVGLWPIPPGTKKLTFRANIAVAGEFSMWADGILVAQYLGDTSTLGQCNKIRLSTYHVSIQSNSFSEVIVASHDVRSARLRTLAITGAGANADWSGSYTDISSESTTDDKFISEDTAGGKASFTKGTLPTNTLFVDALIISAKSRRGEVGPAGIDAYVKISGVDYPLSLGTQTTSLTPKQAIFSTNPATAEDRWNKATVDALEIGVEAKA